MAALSAFSIWSPAAATERRAFPANVSHETGGLWYIVEQNQNNYPHY